MHRWLASLLLSSLVVQVSATPGAGWFQFRGPCRDGVCAETGLLPNWPQGGPPRVWQVSGLGGGYSSPIIADGRLFITGDIGDECRVMAFDLAGKPLWQTANGPAWKKPWGGARSTCTYDAGRVYHYNSWGRLTCLDAVTGREAWTVDMRQRFLAPAIQWGFSQAPLIDGDRVIVSPGGPKALVVALDKRTGKTVWASEPLRFQRTHKFGGQPVNPPQPDTDKAGYASPALMELGGRRLILGASGRHVFAADASSGRLLWTHPVFARWEVIGTAPVVWGDRVFFSAPDDFGGRAFRVRVSPKGVHFEELWMTPYDNCHGGVVHLDGKLYGSGYRHATGWFCLDADSGRDLYKYEELAKGSLIAADGRLYALAESGEVALLEPTSRGFRGAGRFQFTQGRRRDAWAHPVIHQKRLYLRYHDTMTCFDVARQ